MTPLAEYFADELRRARDAAGMTQAQLAAATYVSKSTVAMVETCQRTPTKDLAVAADKALGTDGRFERMVDRLLRAEVNPTWFRPWVSYEEEATEVRWYEPLLVPGLLQTEAYARALLLDDAAVSARVGRQAIVDRAQVCVIVEEGVLYRKVGSAEVMATQLAALAHSRAMVRVLPSDADTRWSYDGPFVIATVDGAEIGYADAAPRGFVVLDPGVVSTMRQRWEELIAESLPRRQSRELILKVAEERWQSNN